MQLHRPECLEEIERMDARILVISFAPMEETKNWVPFFQKAYIDTLYAREGMKMPQDAVYRTDFAADPELRAYHAFGLGRHSVIETYGPRIVWQYLKWIAQGKPVRRTRQDTLQRGGDFVIGSHGLITLSQVGRDQAERPAVSQILAALRK